MTEVLARSDAATHSGRLLGRGALVPLGVAGATALVTVGLRLHDPHVGGSWGLCPLRLVTGLDCPFCGGLRATNDLTHLDLGAAASSNLLFVVSIPLVVVMWGRWLWRRTRDVPPPPFFPGRVAPALVTAYAVVAVLFTIWRNTPWGHGLWA